MQDNSKFYFDKENWIPLSSSAWKIIVESFIATYAEEAVRQWLWSEANNVIQYL